MGYSLRMAAALSPEDLGICINVRANISDTVNTYKKNPLKCNFENEDARQLTNINEMH